MYDRCRLALASAFATLLLAASPLFAAERQALHMVVMDPLAAPLSCPCVEGYAQRDYEELAKYLEDQLGRDVQVTFAQSLEKAIEESARKADLVIGKDSVVRADAKTAEVVVRPIARLTDKKGSTTQRGLIVVRQQDKAQAPEDLVGYEIIFGPADSDEKHAAAIKLLTAAGVPIPKVMSIDQACSDGASKVVEQKDKKVAAVISSYAEPLLEGCGTIKKGELRVIGRTAEVPFITAFATDTLEGADRKAASRALLSLLEAPEVCLKMESLIGFVEPAKKK